MSAIDEPPRLSEDPSSDPELSHFIRALRADVPNSDAIDSLAQSVEARVRGGGGGDGSPVLRRVPWKMAIVGLAAAVIAVLGIKAPQDGEPAVRRPERAEEAIPRPHPVMSTPTESPPPVVLSEEASEEALPRRAHSRRAVREAREREASPPETTPSTPPPEVSNEPPSAETEIALLARARRALRREPARTLALVEEHQARFPNGQFVEEREVLAIDALIALSHHSRAEVRAAQFYARFPNSVHRRHVEEVLASR